MKLVHPDIQEHIELSENYISTLIIENQIFFMEVISDIFNQCHKQDGKCVVSVDNKVLDFSKNVEIITDYLSFDINKKTLITKIYGDLDTIAYDEDNYLMTTEIISKINSYIFELTKDYPSAFESKDISSIDLFKMLKLSLSIESDNILDLILDYMELVIKFNRQTLFVFVNIRSFFSDVDIQLFIDSILLKKINVIFIEASEREKLINEKRLLIDSDLCEIY